jgi:hypothetical protein
MGVSRVFTSVVNTFNDPSPIKFRSLCEDPKFGPKHWTKMVNHFAWPSSKLKFEIKPVCWPLTMEGQFDPKQVDAIF